MRVRVAVACATAAVSCLVLGGGVASAGGTSHPRVTTVVSNLDNPRDLTFTSDGKLFVAEAGHGGATCLGQGPEGEQCAGFTSKISRVWVGQHKVQRVITGLFSIAGPDGSGATGVDGISAVGEHSIHGIITGAPQFIPPSAPADFAAMVKKQIGRVVIGTTGGDRTFGAGVGSRSFVWTSNHKNLVPGQFPDANPYGIFATRSTDWVVDAAANTINKVTDRRVQVVKFIPNPPASDAVPTCIDRGPDGALYIGELTGGGNPPGSSDVWRYSPSSGQLTKWATGLTAVTGCGFGRDGRFYATEFSTKGLDNAAPGTGAVVRVPAHSSKPVTVVGGLNFPGGFAAGSDGSLYVSNWSIAPASQHLGAVIRITM